MTTAPAKPLASEVEQALGAACDHLLGLQSPEGWWKGELQTNVTMDAEDLLLRQFLGIRTEEDTAEAARWIRSQQREDGTWANFHGGPADLSTTIEAYTALRLAGGPAAAAGTPCSPPSTVSCTATSGGRSRACGTRRSGAPPTG
jgi:squalene-hopene/tetraprenyl-beta-curcumene cyclase